jgi:3-phenylpropionate/trans-cinnamate dioxygenase alpha subunit
MVEASKLVDLDGATQSRLVFWDEDIYRQEIERIFNRSWLFLTHESLIPKPGDFVTGRMAEDDVIISRQKDGSIRAFLNTCNHRGAKVCHADSGNAKAFVCNYHGWAYGQDGSLANVPLEDRCYHNSIDKSQLGLRQVRVESYRGFVFGYHDPEAPNLPEWLGEFGWYLDTFMVGPDGKGMELLGPPMKSTLACTWKVPCENFIGDGYHVGWTHAAALAAIGGALAGLSGNRSDMPFDDLGLQITTRHGHGFGIIYEAAAGLHPEGAYAQYLQNTRKQVAERLGP